MNLKPISTCELNPGDYIVSFYTGIHYKVIEPDKKGMAKLLNLDTNEEEDWNSCNNNHFNKLEGQLEIF